MTPRYILQDRVTGQVWTGQPKEGFPTASDAVFWATDHKVPTTYWPMPFVPTEGTTP